jgi:hypothetical protein
VSLTQTGINARLCFCAEQQRTDERHSVPSTLSDVFPWSMLLPLDAESVSVNEFKITQNKIVKKSFR